MPDMPVAPAATAGEVRKLLLSQVRELLIGPSADDEVLAGLEAEPTDIYLTGILWPKNMIIGPAEDDTVEQANADASDPGDDSGTPLFSILKPSSIGLTCSIKGAETPFEVVVYGARYEPKRAGRIRAVATSEQEPRTDDEADSRETAREDVDWIRKPFEYRVTSVGVTGAVRVHEFMDTNGDPVSDELISVYVKRRISQDTQIITASFINEAERDEGDSPGRLAIYQATLEVRAINEDGAGMIIARPPDYGMSDEDSRSGDLLYRNTHEFAVGHGVAAVWPDPENGAVTHVTTDWMPSARVHSVSRTGGPELTSLAERPDSPLRASFLAEENQRAAIVEGLRELCTAYNTWISKEEGRAASFVGVFKTTAAENLEVCRDTLARMEEGAELLATNDVAFRAFCLANEAMDAQSNGRQRGNEAKPLVWFPFQLAFLLLSIKSIVEPTDPTRKVMDLLWFPTGGGKTEAYLGLTAFTIFYRRLKANTPDSKGSHVDVLMRYTLRLLTVQQFQRAAALICAADQIRKRSNDLGSEPISIGLFVGEAATPNKLADGGERSAISILEAERNGRQPSSTPRLLLNCPLCGSDLPVDCYRVDRAIPTMEIVCPDATCPSFGNSLPVFSVDEDIYRARPSLVIGTVDKFALLPRKEEPGTIFGIPHGLPPELIIQDELHLISGPLGTVTGLYEACVDLMCTRDGVPPKIVGSTATIGRARQQVSALFQRGVLQFPPPAIDAEDSFFAVTDRKESDRLYVGIPSVGRSPKFTLQAVTAATLMAAHKLRCDGVSDAILDPYWTALLYFNSLRELGGAEVMMHDDVPRTIEFYAHRLGISGRELQGQPAGLNSRISSTKIPQILKDLAVRLDSDPFAGEPIDLVLASNMISVGMDIPRLGLMIVNGQPKATSEYIQATSRVGRGTPGLVFTLYNGSRPRDMSHFEHFAHYHGTLYRRVEITSVTPWASRARDRALHAIFIAAVRHLVPGMAGRFGAVGLDPRDREVLAIRDWLVERARTSGSEHVTGDQIREDLQIIIDRWAQRARKHQRDGKLEYWATNRPFDNRPVQPHLMRGAEDPVVEPQVWPTPGSMREVEPSAYYVLWQHGNSEEG